jgi:GTPase involved in cell partitioning and DNA repair
MIYRVIERKTNLYRNQFTYWDNKVLYCGINKTQARVAYLSSKPYDYNNGFGETAFETVIEEFESYSKDLRSEEVIFTNKIEIDEQAVKKTIAEIKELNCSETVAISYVRLSKKDNDLNVEIKVGDDWISVIKDEYEKDFIHIVTVAKLSEINNKFRM